MTLHDHTTSKGKPRSGVGGGVGLDIKVYNIELQRFKNKSLLQELSSFRQFWFVCKEDYPAHSDTSFAQC